MTSYIPSGRRTDVMGVKLWYRTLKSNKKSIYLDIHHEGERLREKLNLFLHLKPKTEQEKSHNREANRMASEIRSKRELELMAADYDLKPTSKKQIDILKYLENFVTNYKKKNKRSTEASFNHFKNFLQKTILSSRDLTEDLCTDFRAYLEEKLTGETPYDYFMHFKRMLKQAVKDGMLKANPAIHVMNRRSENDPKDILTFDELQTLASTPCNSPEVRRAFIFACNTGLRGVDIRSLQWGHIQNGTLKVVQSKTQKPVSVNLNATAAKLLGKTGAADRPVFTLPSQNGVNKTLKAWVKRAKLSKHITFHSARHTFATNILLFDGNIATAASLLGHTGLKHILRYVRIADSMKQDAVNKLPTLNV